MFDNLTRTNDGAAGRVCPKTLFLLTDWVLSVIIVAVRVDLLRSLRVAKALRLSAALVCFG